MSFWHLSLYQQCCCCNHFHHLSTSKFHPPSLLLSHLPRCHLLDNPTTVHVSLTSHYKLHGDCSSGIVHLFPRRSIKCADRANYRQGPFLSAFYEKSNRATTAGISFCQVSKLRHHIVLQQPGPMGGWRQKLCSAFNSHHTACFFAILHF